MPVTFLASGASSVPGVSIYYIAIVCGHPKSEVDLGCFLQTEVSMGIKNNTHSKLVGYLAWIFGFMGMHRFYYGRPLSGTLYFFTLGLLGIGWIIDFFLIPSMDEEADHKYVEGDIEYNLAWLLLIFLGFLGIHRFYMGKILTGIIYLCTGGLFFVGWLYDLWTLNEQIDEVNRSSGRG